MEKQNIQILLVESNASIATKIKDVLAKSDVANYCVTWVSTGELGLTTLRQKKDIDIVITDYYLPGMNGAQFARAVLKEYDPNIPVVFVTTNKDMYVVIEVMKLGVKDYLFEESIANPVFPQTIVGLVEKYRLKKEMEELDVKRRRLDAMQEIVVKISNEISEPLAELRTVVSQLLDLTENEKAKKYLSLIKDNVMRMEMKMDKLRNLKDDKTVQYIKDIRMIDLS